VPRRFRPIPSILANYFNQFARRSDIDNLYVQISAMLALNQATGGLAPLQRLRGWAISPDALLHVVTDIANRRSPKVIEFGCGESTLVIGQVLRRCGGGTLTSVEHDPEFAAEIEKRLQGAGLAELVRVICVPLAMYPRRDNFNACTSYDLSAIETEFDVAIIDGPITSVHGSATRLVPLEWCIARLQRSDAIYLDDAHRAEEQCLVNFLKNTSPDVKISWLSSEKGLARFSRESA
jgi:hypothetical protein